MAISQTGFGLKPINKVGSNYNAAQVSEYKSFDRGYDIGFQSPVECNFNQGALAVQTTYAVGDAITGSFLGCQYVSKSTGKPVFADNLNAADIPDDSEASPGNFNKLFSCFVADDPYQLYLIKIDGALTLSQISGNYAPDSSGESAIDANTKISTVKLDSSTQGNNSFLDFKFAFISNNPDDTSTRTGYAGGDGNDVLAVGSNVIVALNNSKFKAGTVGNN